ncbi:MAG: M20/M25/M40 family metallo-hydrolase [Aquaticitalea sp.]
MKTIFSFSFAILMFGCKSQVIDTPSKAIVPTIQTTEISPEVKQLDFITPSELNEIVAYLASDELQGRATGSKGIEKAGIYIENALKSYDVRPYYDTYRDAYQAKGKDAFNVIGVIEGNDPALKNEIIILGAHYDHIGYGKLVENDSIANGANDDASGTAAVMAMARYFGEKKSNKRTIMFALYSGEEMGLLGSKHLAQRLKGENIDLYTMISFEMIGVPFEDRDYVAFLSGFELSNMASKLNDYVDANLLGLSEVAKNYNLFKRSDNYPFYEAFKLPSHTISSCDLSNYDYYHHVDDEADQLNYEFMASLVNQLLPAIEKMSNTPTKEIQMNE